MNPTDYLICPICSYPLKREGKSFICQSSLGQKRHCFDISSSGYSDLSYRNGGGGDPKDAVHDRTLFLDKGYYSPLAEEIKRLCGEYLNDSFLLIDAGCGEGYYSEQIATRFNNSFVFGADLSKHAVHRASVRRNSRSGENSFYAVASVFKLPVLDSVADCALSMFAPVAEEEINRVLKQGGYLLIGAAGERHLYQLKEAIYDSVHLNEERADLPRNMDLIAKTNVHYSIYIDNSDDIRRLFGMTPYRFRTSEQSMILLYNLNSLSVEIDVDFYLYKKQIL